MPQRKRTNPVWYKIYIYLCTMTTNEKENTNYTSYIYMKSDVVPEWVSKLEVLKSSIREKLRSSELDALDNVKFCHPFNVPNTKK